MSASALNACQCSAHSVQRQNTARQVCCERACILHAAQGNLVMDLLCAQALRALPHNEAVHLRITALNEQAHHRHAPFQRTTSVNRPGTTVQRPKDTTSSYLTQHLLHKPCLLRVQVSRPDANDICKGGIADPPLLPIQHPAAVYLRWRRFRTSASCSTRQNAIALNQEPAVNIPRGTPAVD